MVSVFMVVGLELAIRHGETIWWALLVASALVGMRLHRIVAWLTFHETPSPSPLPHGGPIDGQPATFEGWIVTADGVESLAAVGFETGSPVGRTIAHPSEYDPEHPLRVRTDYGLITLDGPIEVAVGHYEAGRLAKGELPAEVAARVAEQSWPGRARVVRWLQTGDRVAVTGIARELPAPASYRESASRWSLTPLPRSDDDIDPDAIVAAYLGSPRTVSPLLEVRLGLALLAMLAFVLGAAKAGDAATPGGCFPGDPHQRPGAAAFVSPFHRPVALRRLSFWCEAARTTAYRDDYPLTARAHAGACTAVEAALADAAYEPFAPDDSYAELLAQVALRHAASRSFAGASNLAKEAQGQPSRDVPGLAWRHLVPIHLLAGERERAWQALEIARAYDPPAPYADVVDRARPWLRPCLMASLAAGAEPNESADPAFSDRPACRLLEADRWGGATGAAILDACEECLTFPSLRGGTLLLTYDLLDCAAADSPSPRCYETAVALEEWAGSGTIGVPTLEQAIVSAIDAHASPSVQQLRLRSALAHREPNPARLYKTAIVPRELAIALYVWPADGPPPRAE